MTVKIHQLCYENNLNRGFDWIKKYVTGDL